METSGYTTAGGIGVEREVRQVPEEALEEIVTALGERRGGAFSSGMDYPGRYSRWAFGYVDPCLELVAKGRRISARALNARGRVVLPAVVSCLLAAGKPVEEPTADFVEVHVPESADLLTEEMRSRRPTVFTAIREVIAAFRGDDPHLGLYGSFGYDLAFQFEPIRQELVRPDDQRDLVLHLPDRLVVIDRQRETSVEYRYEFTVDGATTRGLERTGASVPITEPAEVPADPKRGDYAKVVAAAKEKFKRGDLFEVVPGQVFHATCTDPSAFFRGLRHSNPAPYEFIISLGEGEHLVGASPEMYVRVSGDRVETCPISGTIARGSNPIEDAEAIRTLLTSVKEESELTMCTDVDRNDKSRICVPGSVRVIGRRQIELYSRLIHTVDHIEGRLRPEFDALDAFLTHMWAVTVTGAPKTWAMQFIEDHEATTRRWYGGAIGFIGFDGSMNTGLTLRTAQIKNGLATVRAGATLLFDSDPEAEERETELKASALLGALAAVNQPHAQPVTPTREQPGQGMKVLLVDHEDSFVNTLADYFRQEGAEVVTLRHGFPAAMLDDLAPDLVVLSPGPGWPSDFGMSALIDQIYARDLPVFGVCLGLQAMVEHAGGSLELLDYPEHGKRGQVTRLGGGDALLDGLPEEFVAARYHSLHAKRAGVVGFTPTAVTPDGNVMAIEDTERRRFAVQFHPESILTAEGGAGAKVIANVLRLARR